MIEKTGWINNRLFVFLILLLAGGLRIYHLDFQSIWIDEVNTMVQARPDISFTETYKGLFMDLQPPLYFYLLKLMFSLFGYTTFIARLFSALAGVAGVWAVFRLGRELHNERTGIYAALLLSVNYFHIYYSQEARPYTFLFLFAALSFEQLVRFIKSPDFRRAVIYGLMAALMLYGHAYGTILLFSQYLFLFVCLVATAKEEKLRFLRLCILAGVTTAVLFIPALQLFASAAGIKNFWIPPPGADVFTQVLAEFFGRSETVLAMVYLLLLLYFFSVLRYPSGNNFLHELKTNNPSTVFVLLLIWLLCGLLIPFIRSHLKVPMIVSRYLIGLLPVVLLMIAVALSLIGQRIVRNFLLVSFLLFSLTDIFIVKNYYNKIGKSQLREITEYIRQNNTARDPVVTDLWWHYAYFFSKDNYKVPQMSPAEYVGELMKANQNMKPFWYSSGHHFTFAQLPEDRRKFLEDNFYVAQKLELAEAWAILFVPKQGKGEELELKLSDFQPMNAGSGTHIFLYADTLITSAPFHLSPGRYTLYISGYSEPEKPVYGTNAHLSLFLNGQRFGGLFLREGKSPTQQRRTVIISNNDELRLGVAFDNDLTVGKSDRNALIYAVKFVKEHR